MNQQQALNFYTSICKCVDGYVFVCNYDANGYSAKLTEDMIEEFNLPSDCEHNYFKYWIERIHEEDRDRYISTLQCILEGITPVFNIQYRVLDKENHYIWVDSQAYMIYDEEGKPKTVSGVVRNMGKRNQLDHLTGLLNKYAFREDVKGKIKKGIPFGILLLNIDDFKHINELYTQSFGDNVLRVVGIYIQSRLESNQAIYRLDGDEFAIVFTRPCDGDSTELYNRVSNHYKTQKELLGKRYHCTFSGTYYEHDNVSDYESIVKSLKVGMHIVKRQGKKRVINYNPEFLKYKERELELIELLRESIENNFSGFDLNFQPQVYADNKCLKGAEALLRWQCEKYGKVSPVEFIPLLEKTEMIQEVGKWVFKKAVEMCKRWVCINPSFTMSINVSYLQLFDPTFIDYMRECVEGEDIDYQNIVVEITESKFISDKELLKRVFDSVRAMGMKIAMDDFGTGYSSLGVLKEAPADIVKIDKIFVRNIKKNSFDSSFIRVVVELCHQVGIKVCLEGVEELEEMEVVSDMDLDFIQGYLYGRPEEAEEFYQKYIQHK